MTIHYRYGPEKVWHELDDRVDSETFAAEELRLLEYVDRDYGRWQYIEFHLTDGSRMYGVGFYNDYFDDDPGGFECYLYGDAEACSAEGVYVERYAFTPDRDWILVKS